MSSGAASFFSTDKDLLLHVLSVHYYLLVNITLSVDDDIVRQARSRAKAMGKSVNQLVREYLERLAGKPDLQALVAEFRELTRNARGNSRGWKSNREEIHERR